MGWRDWIEPREASQVSPVSASQNSRARGQVSQESQLSASQIEKITKETTEKDVSGDSATVTTATAATVRCTDCRNFTASANNPDQGLGACAVNAPDRMPWPALARACSRFEISRPALERIAREISTDPEMFAAAVWADGIYIHPTHIRRLAQLVNERGIPSDWSKSS